MAKQYDDDYEPRDDDYENSREDGIDQRTIARAKNITRGPAIGLLISAIIGILFSIYILFSVNHPAFDQGYDMQIQANANDPNKTDAEKKQMKQFMEDMRKPMKSGLNFWSIISIIVNLLILFASIMLMALKARALGYLASILAILPLTNCCCVIGSPFGIWTILALGKPEVKEGFAAAARGSR